jgi:predicted porin
LAACGASFAQSTVTISGVLDAGYRSVNAPAGTGGDTSGGFQNGTATSSIVISGTEDLGGGMRALFRYEMNPDFVGGSGLSGSAISSGAAGVATSNGANGYNFVGISTKDMGAVRFGRLNTASLGAWGTGSVFGTALGSGFSTNGNMYTVNSAATNNFNQTAPTRFNGAVEYTSATINGFTARALFVPKVDNTGPGSTDAAAGSFAGTNRAGVTDIGLAYNAGPLNVAAAQQKHSYGANAINTVATPGGGASVAAGGTTTSVPNATYTLNTLAANYTMGATTVFAMTWTEKQDTSAASAVPLDAVGTQVGARHISGPWTFMGAYSKRDDKTTSAVDRTSTTSNAVTYANADRTTLGVGADYALSKRTAIWFRYQAVDPNTNRSGMNSTGTTASGSAIAKGTVDMVGTTPTPTAPTAAAAAAPNAALVNAQTSFDKVTTMAVGIRHSF